MSNFKIYLSEEQINEAIKSQILVESIFNKNMSFMEILKTVKKLGKKNLLTAAIVAGIISFFNLNNEEAKQIEQIQQQYEQTEQVNDEKPKQIWNLASDNVQATVYNAVPEQCNNDISHTASMFRLNLSNVLSHRIIAMERTFMKQLGLSYGDVVKIEGTGEWDGIWQIQDTMNKRFAGQHKIDILVPNSIKYGKWDNIKLYTLSNDIDSNMFKTNMAPQLSKSQALKQAKEIQKLI